MSRQQHQSTPKVLDRRTLQRDHRVLAGLLVPGMAVLDVGCGTGAITRGIAEAVGPMGVVVGVDRDRGLLERARVHGAAVPNLLFEEGDATGLTFDARFDIVTAARTLQWVADLGAAIDGMARAARPGGRLVILDYNHGFNEWEPAPPQAFAEFYARFLTWREANGWDNSVGKHIPALLEQHGLPDVRCDAHDVTTARGDDDFDEQTGLWVEVIDRLGPAMEAAGQCDAALIEAARRSYDGWRRTDLMCQTLSMAATVATIPSQP
jgi:SAM-dependent methyltransferase